MTLAATLALMSAGNDQYLTPVPELSSKPLWTSMMLTGSMDRQTDGQTDTQPLHRCLPHTKQLVSTNVDSTCPNLN